MAEIIRMPRMSDTMEEGNIVEWLKKEGDAVEPGDVLAEVETDKATMELESYHEGVLLHIGVKEGPVPVNGILAVIGEKGEDYAAQLEEAQKSSDAAPSSDTQDEAVKTEAAAPAAPVVMQATATTAPPATTAQSEGRVKASPLAKKMAADNGAQLDNIIGTGENGRIIKKDVERYIEDRKSGVQGGSSVPAMMQHQAQTDFQYGDVALSQMRKVIAKRLAESKFSAPHFYLTIEIDMAKTIEARKDINENAEVRISFNDFVVKAAAAALRKHPKINSSWMGDRITYHQHINIGVAVAVDEGLLVPVVNNADLKSMSAINTEVREMAGRAKIKKLQPQEMQGNTFTISNLGMFDIDEFTAIINPPDACILAVGSIQDKPIVKDGAVVPGKIMKVTLSCDHRVVDGATGAEFLKTFKSFLENPVRILV